MNIGHRNREENNENTHQPPTTNHAETKQGNQTSNHNHRTTTNHQTKTDQTRKHGNEEAIKRKLIKSFQLDRCAEAEQYHIHHPRYTQKTKDRGTGQPGSRGRRNTTRTQKTTHAEAHRVRRERAWPLRSKQTTTHNKAKSECRTKVTTFKNHWKDTYGSHCKWKSKEVAKLSLNHGATLAQP